MREKGALIGCLLVKPQKLVLCRTECCQRDVGDGQFEESGIGVGTGSHLLVILVFNFQKLASSFCDL